LGVAVGFGINAGHNANFDLFTNIQSNIYWAGEELADRVNAAGYDAGTGSTTGGAKTNALKAWAVRPGNRRPGPGGGLAVRQRLGRVGRGGPARQESVVAWVI
jgi:hypothetical protein